MSPKSRESRRGNRDRATAIASESGTFDEWLVGRTVEEVPSLRTLEHLAHYSPRHAAALRALNSADAEHRRQRSIMEWCAHLMTGGSSERHSLRGPQERDVVRGLRLPHGRALVQEEWDPAEHPRAPKGQADGGQWVGKGDSVGTRGGFDYDAARGSPASKPLRPDILLLPAAIALGHHWGPLAAAKSDTIRPRLSRDARIYLVGAYSGPTDPSHGFGPMNGVSHYDYNLEVKKELEKFIEANVKKTRQMSGPQMARFLDLIESGKGADGKENELISKFNKGIKDQVKAGYKGRPSYKKVMELGRARAKDARFRDFLAGGLIATLVADLLMKHAKGVEVVARTPHFREALEELRKGDLGRAQTILTGDQNSLYVELLTAQGVGPTAALNFRRAVDHLFASPITRGFLDGLDGALDDETS